MNFVFSTRTPLLLGFLAATVCASPQAAAPATAAPLTPDQLKAKGWTGINFETKLGSFKVIDGEGHLEFTFKGTVLVAGLKGTIEKTGTIRQEYDGHGRQVYSGTGKIVCDGSWRGVQWFGSDMTGRWVGKGVLRVSGEFDRDLKTGEYWYDGDTEHSYWQPSGVMSLYVPKLHFEGMGGDVVPKERKKPGS